MTLNLLLIKRYVLPVIGICLFWSYNGKVLAQDSTKNFFSPQSKTFKALNTLSCTGSLGDPIVNFTFGAGANFGPPLASTVNNMRYIANTCPNDGYYTITNYTSGCFSDSWYAVSDHTRDPNGYFMLVNASYEPSDFYVQRVDGLCSGTTYQFSAWIVNVIRSSTAIRPDITFSIEKTDGTVLQSFNTGSIPGGAPEWKQYAMYFTTPVGTTSVVIRMKNNAPGGIGNDLGLDDIAFRPAGPLTAITIAGNGDSVNICNSMVNLTSNIESCYLNNEYQWQQNVNGGGWINIPGANTVSYTVPFLPPGKYNYRLLVSAAGNIQISNCRVSSNITTVVVVPPPLTQGLNKVICSGESYKLPSGRLVSQPGNYRDTVRYSFGCDSLITSLQLAVNYPIAIDSSKAICEGQSFVLPSGFPVTKTGDYHDTIHYRSTGCDSLIRTIHLAVKPVFRISTWVNICLGQTTMLPWGVTVMGSGVYSDTTRYISGCDSLIRSVQVHVTAPVSQSMESTVCPGESYLLPSGKAVSVPGTYRDTLRTGIGCDSLITFLSLKRSPPPVIQLTKSNDITCSLGISKLNAAGGATYRWSPANSLDNPNSANPIASPAANTVYRVRVTSSAGCVGEDSIAVNVLADPALHQLLIPNAFTPNNDGLNDCFGVKFLGQVSELKFSIYNRWGERVFYTENSGQCWNGISGGVPVKSDVFVYQLSAVTICGKIFRKGTVMLIR